MARFTLEAKHDVFTDVGRFPTGTTVSINVPSYATASTFLTNPNFKMTILSQFKEQGIVITPNLLGYGHWKVTDTQR